MIDIVGSLLIGGMLLVLTMKMDENSVRTTYETQENLTVQQNLTSLIQNVEFDFRRIGYRRNGGAPPANQCILYGRGDSIAFLADLGDSGTMNTVRWYLGGKIPGSSNPNLRMLYRQVDAAPPTGANLGVADFQLDYLDAFGVPVDTPYIAGAPGPPNLIRLTIKVEPTAAYDTAFATNFAVWRETRLVSRNLIR